MSELSFLYKLRYSLLRSDITRNFVYRIFYKIYRKLYVNYRVQIIRKKAKIKVLFVISELGVWKTEELYLAMCSSPRFSTYLLVDSVMGNGNYEEVLVSYLRERGYPFFSLDKEETIKNIITPDIIFYQKPYGDVTKKNDYYRNLYALFCYVSYGFHSIKDSDYSFFHSAPLNNLAWQNYYENELALKYVSQNMPNKAINCVVTGLPMTDSYLKECESDPWKPQYGKKKRIIWAPHHTVSSQEWINYSTFLKYSEFMLDMAKKYSGKVQFAFKPHPSLKSKLDIMWGKEKADYYYHQWESMENTQYEAGNYVDLFKTSDAMIHDCGSFTVEYHYTKKPVMYLVKDEHHADGLNDFGKMAFDLHYKGCCKEDIDTFIQNIIEGKDEMEEARIRFFSDYLLPPAGKTASENIINMILKG